jgi:hypothetical protein
VQNGEKGSALITMIAGSGIGYVCPQFIRKDAVSGPVSIFFRVREPKANVSLTLSANGKEFSTVKKLRVAPSEMESLSIPKEALADASEITLALKEEA